MFNRLKNMGPGVLIAAAFIGPGTITACSLAGVKFGYDLLWALGISTFATIILQEMSARAGLVTRKGLAELIRTALPNPLLKKAVLGIIFSAIVIGNAAYEAGNLTGGVLGLQAIIPETMVVREVWLLLLGTLAGILLFFGNYKILERVLVVLVIVMSLSFIITALASSPNLSAIAEGLFTFQNPEGSLWLVLGLVGTTVVPYNLFLHASIVQKKWSSPTDLPSVRYDTGAAILLGGIVSMCVLLCAIPLAGTNLSSAGDLAKGLEPLLGSYARYFLGIGLFAAGLTSAITAPLAASYVAAGCFGWSNSMKNNKFRAVWALILVLGVGSSFLKIKPIEIIQFAQIANGLLLPLIAGILLWVMNQEKLLGKYRNNLIQNLLGLSVFLFALFLGAKGIWKVFG